MFLKLNINYWFKKIKKIIL